MLWRLIKSGTLEKGSVLFWDELEANINPKYIPVLAELLIMLESEVQYISLYKDDEEKVQCETATEFELLEHKQSWILF